MGGGGILDSAAPGITPYAKTLLSSLGAADRFVRGAGCEVRKPGMSSLGSSVPVSRISGRVDEWWMSWRADRYRGFLCAARKVMEALHGEIEVALPPTERNSSCSHHEARQTDTTPPTSGPPRPVSCSCGRGQMPSVAASRPQGAAPRTTGPAGGRPDRSEDETPRLECHLKI